MPERLSWPLAALAACDRPGSQLGARSWPRTVRLCLRLAAPSPALRCASHGESVLWELWPGTLARGVFGTVAAATGGFACGCSFRAAVGKEIKGGDPTMACWHVKRWRSHRKRESRCAQRRSMQTHVLSDRSRYFCTEFSRMARDASENRHRRGLRAVSGMVVAGMTEERSGSQFHYSHSP